MDTVVIAQKLESLRRCLQRLKEKCPEDPAAFVSDPDLQDIVVLNLTRAVQLSVDIASHLISHSNEPAPETMGESFILLEKMKVIDPDTANNLKKAVGFRNIAVHNYDAINWDIVHSICKNQLKDFTDFAGAVIKYSSI